MGEQNLTDTIRETAGNDGSRNGRSNATHLLRNALIDLWNHPKMRPLSYMGNRCLYNSLIRSQESNTNQGGANVWPHNTQAHWGLRTWVNSKA